MDTALLETLRQITPEEARLLRGGEIDRSIYMTGDSSVVDASLLLERGKLISLRPHTRFVSFPRHTHNYVEMVYMCSGETRHIVNGNEIRLRAGELLMMRPHATQEIDAAGENDVAINFIILPQFFDTAIHMLGEEAHPIREFLIQCLCGRDDGAGYLHFAVSDILPIQNLVENLIWTLVHHQPNKRSLNQLTMGLLFLQLTTHTETLRTEPNDMEKRLLLPVYRYVEEQYRNGTLQDIAGQLHYDVYWLSREIKRRTGKTFTELMQEKRLSQAVFLLKTTRMNVGEISESVGYENFSYFHRLFKKRYGVSPHAYRTCK